MLTNIQYLTAVAVSHEDPFHTFRNVFYRIDIKLIFDQIQNTNKK